MSITSSTRRCIQFSLKEIKEATNQFSKILGHGGETVVYYGVIYIDLNKTPVAVKRLKKKRDNSKEFKNEINTLSKIQHHPNIVSLIGYCDESGQKILVYEYMKKGSLSRLLKKENPNALTWLQRLNICLDVARGLQHLHSQTDDFPKGIIHCDMKPGNILVGENWIGKVSDFGMLKLSTAGQEISIMPTGLKGTSGFIAPEYSRWGHVTRKIDVFSFGVVLFYVLCEKTPWIREDENYCFIGKDDLGKWALENIVAQIRGQISRDSETLFTDLIRRSLQMNPGKRPTMDDVVLELEKVLECSGGLLTIQKGGSESEEEYPSEGPPEDDTNFQESENPPEQLEDFWRNDGCCQFSLEEIIAATNQFDKSQIIGRGGSGRCISLSFISAQIKLL